MSLAAIEVRFPDKILKPDDVERRRVLSTLEVMYEGGSLHGTTDDFPTRDLSQIVIGLHRRNWHFLETYKRSICIDIRSRRVIFRCADMTFKPNKKSWRDRLLAVLCMHKPKPIVDFLLAGVASPRSFADWCRTSRYNRVETLVKPLSLPQEPIRDISLLTHRGHPAR